MVITVYCDGGSRGNPGPAASGVVMKADKIVIDKFGKVLGITTNNVAEYTAVVEALKWLFKNREKYPATRVRFFLDSLLVVSQLNGLFKIKNEKLKPLFMKIRELEGDLGGNISYEHIPREQNFEADEQVNKTLDEAIR